MSASKNNPTGQDPFVESKTADHTDHTLTKASANQESPDVPKDLLVNDELAEQLKASSLNFKSHTLSKRQQCDLELLLNGGFSPLTGFLNQADYESVLDNNRLADGALWPMPIVLDVSSKFASSLELGQKLALRDKRRSVLDIPALTVPTKIARAQQTILIVDDSITTRTLEKNILEAAGYSIQLATDGQEALTSIAAGEIPDLVVSDVAMPRVNGFELTRRLKDDPHTNHVPVILVTSLDSAADKARGIEAGADAYITKGTFDQSNLLETIEQLI